MSVAFDALKILFVITVLARAGAEQALVNLLPELQKRGHDCQVAVLRPPYDLAPDLEAHGIVVHRLDASRHDLPRSLSRLVSLCRMERFDILHGHLVFAAICTALARFAVPQSRAVVSFHNVDYDLFPATTLPAKIVKTLTELLLKNRIQGHTGVSRAVARHYEAHLHLPHVWVIPNAFPTDVLRPDPNLHRASVLNAFGLSPEDFILVMPARLVPEKGHRFLLQALEILRARGVRPKALILGNGPLQQTLQRQIEARALDDQVRLHPAVPHAQLFPVVQASDLFVMASTHEGFGLAPAEAMALETPVIATQIGGIEDVVTPESGWMIPPRNAQALADGIEHLMNDADLRHRLSQAGRARIVQQFSTPVVAERWETFYKELAS